MSSPPIHVLDQRQNGRRLVFAAIRDAGRIARIDIADRTTISAATVTSITAEMIKSGLIEEVARDPEHGEMKRGRPRVDLQVRGDAHRVAGIKLSQQKASVAIMDFAGNHIADYERATGSTKMSQERLVGFVHGLLDDATAACGLSLADLSGVGIGLAGFVDAPNGFLHWSPQLEARNVDLRTPLETELGLPVFLDNDANLVAVAEKWFGLGQDFRNFIVVTIEHGVGMGIVLDNRLYRGARGCGAEFGHTKVQNDGALCRCGQRGCLEAYLADYALLREANVATQATDHADSTKKLRALLDEARAGNTSAQSIFTKAGKMFAMGLANMVNIFDPELIIVSGERMQFDYLVAEDVLDQMKDMVVQVDAPPPEVRIHNWGDDMWARGAAAYAIDGVTEISLANLATA